MDAMPRHTDSMTLTKVLITACASVLALLTTTGSTSSEVYTIHLNTFDLSMDEIEVQLLARNDD